MQVGTVGAGRIGSAVLRRLKPFDVGLHYTDRHRLPDRGRGGARRDLPPRRRSRWSRVCDVVTINTPLHPETEHLFDDELIGRMKRGAYLVNTARGKICDRDAVVRALESGQLAGLRGRRLVPAAGAAGPPVADDAAPRHDAAHLGHEPLRAGALRGRARARSSSAGSTGRPIREEYLIVDGGKLAGAGAHSYSAGDATGGSDEAARFKSG